MEKTIKMIVGDLDDTILDEGKKISSEMIKVRRKIKDLGLLFTIATARSVLSASKYIMELEPDFVISCDGGMVIHQNELLFFNSLSKCQTDRVLKKIIGNEKIRRISIVTLNQDYDNYGGIALPDTFNTEIVKVICEVMDNDLITIWENENQDLLFSRYEGQLWIRISNKKATKYDALCQICNAEGILIDQVMAFGDDYNDMTMIQKCGVGIAVSNAVPMVKSVADYITDNNNCDGVAKFIKKYFKI